MNQTQEEIQNIRIRQLFEPRLQRVLSDAEVLEIRTSLHFLGKAIARYERKQNERNGN